MLIQIESGERDTPRRVWVTPDAGAPVSFMADDLADAHKLIKRGRKDGWEAVTGDTLARDTKAATAVEDTRIQTGKAAAEPKKGR